MITVNEKDLKSTLINDLFHVRSSKRVLKSQWKKEGIPFYRGREITSLSKNSFVDNELFIDEDLYMEFSIKHGIPKAEDIMITAIGTIGNSYIVQKEDRFYFKDGSVLWLDKKSEVNSKYINYWLKSEHFTKQLDKGNGATVDTLTISKMASCKVITPSLPVQKQIVEKLDATFAGIDKAINATEKNIENAEALFQRNLFDIFEGEHATRKTSTVGDIADHCLGKMLDKNKNKGALQPYLRNTNVQWFSVNTDDILLMKFEPKEEERFSVKRGDLLICEGGYPGRAAIWEKEEVIYFQKALHRVRCKERIYNKWLMYYLFYLSSNNKLAYYFTGSGIQHFTGKSLKKLSIPVPSIQDTSSHLRILDLLFDQIESIKSIYSTKISLYKKLKISMLNQAFSGELTKDAA